MTSALALSTLFLASAGAESGGDALAFRGTMVLWTWITFGLVALVLYKAAWKPILAALEAREDRVRQSIDDARRAEEELAGLEATRRAMLADTEARTQAMVAEARVSAAKAAESLEQRAHEKIKVLYENAERDILALRERVEADLRGRHVDLIVDLAGRLVRENMNTEKNRALADRLIAEMR